MTRNNVNIGVMAQNFLYGAEDTTDVIQPLMSCHGMHFLSYFGAADHAQYQVYIFDRTVLTSLLPAQCFFPHLRDMATLAFLWLHESK